MKDMSQTFDPALSGEAVGNVPANSLSASYVEYRRAVNTQTDAAGVVTARTETVLFNFAKPEVKLSPEIASKERRFRKVVLVGHRGIEKRAKARQEAQREALEPLRDSYTKDPTLSNWAVVSDAALEANRIHYNRLNAERARRDATYGRLCQEISQHREALLTAAVEPLKAEFVSFLKASGVECEADQISIQGIGAPGQVIGFHVPASTLNDAAITKIHEALGGKPVGDWFSGSVRQIESLRPAACFEGLTA